LDSDIWEATADQCSFLKPIIGLDAQGIADCDASVQIHIYIKIGDHVLDLGVDNLIRRNAEVDSDRCITAIRCGAKISVLPMTVLSKVCILYDYKANQVGFATRIQNK
jgi:hypothetical protein